MSSINRNPQSDPKDMVWSFTRLSAFDECPYKFYKTYIEGYKESENAFAQWGKFMHELLAKNAQGQLNTNKLAGAYKRGYKRAVNLPFPYSFGNKELDEQYYNDGVGFWFYYDGRPSTMEVLGVEQKLEYEIADFKFKGFLDLLLRDKMSGDIYLIDHKSKRGFKSKREKRDYARQLYLYSVWVEGQYGTPPKAVVFDMLRLCSTEVIPYDVKARDEAIEWAKDVVDRACRAIGFPTKLELSAERRELEQRYAAPDYFCRHICGQRTRCPAFEEVMYE